MADIKSFNLEMVLPNAGSARSSVWECSRATLHGPGQIAAHQCELLCRSPHQRHPPRSLPVQIGCCSSWGIHPWQAAGGGTPTAPHGHSSWSQCKQRPIAVISQAACMLSAPINPECLNTQQLGCVSIWVGGHMLTWTQHLMVALSNVLNPRNTQFAGTQPYP